MELEKGTCWVEMVKLSKKEQAVSEKEQVKEYQNEGLKG